MQAILGYAERPDGANPEWSHKAGIVAGMTALSPEDAAGAQLQPGQQMVRCFMAMAPRAAAGDGTTDSKDAPGD
jgi:hypothetical protein